MFFRLLASSLALLLGGCASTPNPLSMPFDDPEAAHLIVGMALDRETNAWPRSAHFDLYQVGGKDSIGLGFGHGDINHGVHAIAVQPGEYEIRNVHLNMMGDHTIYSRRPFAVRFSVEPGKAYHLGDFRLLCRNAGNWLRYKPVCAFFLGPRDAEVQARVRQRYPQIGEVQYARLENLVSAYPIISFDAPALLKHLRESVPAQPEPAATP